MKYFSSGKLSLTDNNSTYVVESQNRGEGKDTLHANIRMASSQTDASDHKQNRAECETDETSKGIKYPPPIYSLAFQIKMRDAEASKQVSVSLSNPKKTTHLLPKTYKDS